MAEDPVVAEIAEDFEETYGYAFRDRGLIALAMVDPSYVLKRGPRRGKPHNRRLEHVGDALVCLVMRERLYKEYPYFETSDMEMRVSAWASNQSLAAVAKAIGLEDFLLRDMEGGNVTVRQLACVLEAVLGALMLDGGYETARSFVETWVIPNLPRDALSRLGDQP